MKKPLNYKPVYSLSIKYLKMIMTHKEYNQLLAKYVAKKMEFWGPYRK